jgi:excisionase family DNA binding protein
VSERLLKAREVAELLGLELGTVLDYFERGELPGFRLGGSVGRPVRFRSSEIEEWLLTTCRVDGKMGIESRNGPAARERPGPGTGGVGSHARRRLRRDRD